MSHDTLEFLVSRALAEAKSTCSFAFQGGEPTLAGLNFFEKLVELQKKHNTKGLTIANSIQTNGLLLDHAYAEFFAKNDFLLGLSLDGSKALHDQNRLDAAGKGTYNRVMKAAKLLDKYKVEYNILFVVTRDLARRAAHVYRFFKENDFRYLQFIPCIDDFNTPRGSKDFSLTSERFLTFLKNFFDLWYRDYLSGDYVSIRHFDNWVGILAGLPPESCSMSGVCTAYGVIESNGDVYPCDFYVTDEWKLGNIRNASFKDLLESDKAKSFVTDSLPLPEKCKTCPHFYICRNGCRRDREDASGTLDINVYCEAYYEFFDYATDRMRQIAAGLRR